MQRTLLVCLVTIATTVIAGCGDDGPMSPSPSDQMTITSVTPDSGLATATTAIVIKGTGFRSGAQVSVGGVDVLSNVSNSTTITASAPAHAVGPVDVVVSQSLASRATLPGGFTYLPAVTAVAISGKLVLERIGETSQLTATATFADGSTRNVTTSTRWSVAMPSIARIGPDGLLVAVGEGVTAIFAQYPATGTGNTMRFANALASVTPLGTFAVSGRTREPGAGDLNGVLVRNPASGRSATSANGTYTFGGLTDDSLSLTLSGFEPVEIRATRNGFDDVPMQRILRIDADGPAVTSRIAPNDLAYDVGAGARCEPCRLIRINGSGSLTVLLTWTAPSRVLSIWLNGARITPNAGAQALDVPVVGSGEAILYVGSTVSLGNQEHIPFSIRATR
ncbi:MAG: IPT/TIG domain-containing protein [Acidobacteriota bacterium]